MKKEIDSASVVSVSEVWAECKNWRFSRTCGITDGKFGAGLFDRYEYGG